MIGLTLLSLAGTAYGAYQSSQANKANEEILRKNQNELQAWFNNEYHRNQLATPEARSAIRVMLNQHEKEIKKARGRRAITGGTAEQEVAMQGQSQENMARLLNQILMGSAGRKDNLRRDYMRTRLGLDSTQMGLNANKAQQWSNFMSNAANLGVNSVMADQGMGKQPTGGVGKQPAGVTGGVSGLNAPSLGGSSVLNGANSSWQYFPSVQNAIHAYTPRYDFMTGTFIY